MALYLGVTQVLTDGAILIKVRGGSGECAEGCSRSLKETDALSVCEM